MRTEKEIHDELFAISEELDRWLLERDSRREWDLEHYKMCNAEVILHNEKRRLLCWVLGLPKGK
jgi:hypothetical protein